MRPGGGGGEGSRRRHGSPMEGNYHPTDENPNAQAPTSPSILTKLNQQPSYPYCKSSRNLERLSQPKSLVEMVEVGQGFGNFRSCTQLYTPSTPPPPTHRAHLPPDLITYSFTLLLQVSQVLSTISTKENLP